MRPVCGFLMLVFLLSFSIASGQKENSSVLDKKITLEINNSSIASILDNISSIAGVYFSYDASLIEAEKKTSISVSNKSLQETLDLLFNSKFIYRVLNDQIIITKPEAGRVKKKSPTALS